MQERSPCLLTTGFLFYLKRTDPFKIKYVYDDLATTGDFLLYAKELYLALYFNFLDEAVLELQRSDKYRNKLVYMRYLNFVILGLKDSKKQSDMETLLSLLSEKTKRR